MRALCDHECENGEGKAPDDAENGNLRKKHQPHMVTKHGDGGDDLERVATEKGKIRFFVHKKLLHR